jgi:hypothetical protein
MPLCQYLASAHRRRARARSCRDEQKKLRAVARKCVTPSAREAVTRQMPARRPRMATVPGMFDAGLQTAGSTLRKGVPCRNPERGPELLL